MGSETVGAVKIMSYLEKKGKLKVVTTWKKYWFVLEGRLLLYYRSQEEYENLSPFKGSINMGLATNIRPGLATAGVFQIVTRTNTITLRAKERSVQEKWLQALLDASGHQTASNPIKMSHFRYSMDDLIPTGAKLQHHQTALTRQNTLPHRFRNSRVERTQSIVQRIRSIGGQSYGGSLDTINKLSKVQLPQDPLGKMSEKSINEADSDAENEVYQRNDLYGGIIIENTEYISANGEPDLKNDVDHNKNCYIIENDQYIKSDEVVSVKSDSSTPENSKTRPDGVEYYCTYEDINAMKTLIANKTSDTNFYNEPVYASVKPEDRKSESDDCACGRDDKKISKLSKFTRKLKGSGNELQKKSANLIMKLKGKKKNGADAISEPIYDSVDYQEINKIQQEQRIRSNSDQLLVKQLMDLQQTLEAKKNKLKEIMDSQSPTSAKLSETETEAAEGKKEEQQYENRNSFNNTQPPEDLCRPPGLPPRRGSKTRSRSPFHDVPKNNSPVLLTNPEQLPEISSKDYSIDKILNDLELESKKTDAKQTEELTVRQLIEKFNQVGHEENNQSTSSETEGDDVSLRQKSDSSDEAVDLNAILMNRHSDELYKLLEELTKVTSAPLLTPGVTSSLVQMKSQPLTDEEWLAIAPIRRRRHSEPDYDVPRPHRSLQILPRSPEKDNNEEDTVIPATRFFGPVLPPNTVSEKPLIDPSMSWRSMTPDSLEPLQLLQAALKKQQRLEHNISSDVERDRSLDYERTSDENKIVENGTHDIVGNDMDKVQNVSKILENISVEMKAIDNYLDSLEPFNEDATAF